jgi:hypothetical protein
VPQRHAGHRRRRPVLRLQRRRDAVTTTEAAAVALACMLQPIERTSRNEARESHLSANAIP